MRQLTDTPSPNGSWSVARALLRHFGMAEELATVLPEQTVP